MKKLLFTLTLFPIVSIAQNTWNGSTISTQTNGTVGIGTAPVSNSGLRINNSNRIFGINNESTSNLTGTQYGIYNYVSNTATTGTKYGIYSYLTGPSPNKYGIYTHVVGPGSGAAGSGFPATSYALYAIATGEGTRSGYFKGDVEMNNSNTIYSNNSGHMVLLHPTNGSGSFTIALNQTNNQHDWDWGTSLELKKSGEMRKNIKTNGIALAVNKLGVDVFRIYGDGKVFATEVNVRLASNFPDYVFSPTYDLRSIDELNNYIQKNGKLPNMPSATEVEKEGLNVGETSRLLVEKIEELTLYIIQQQEIIKNQEKRLNELEEKVK